MDTSPDPLVPGRRCIRVTEAITTPRPTPPPGGILCGRLFCFPTLNEVSVGINPVKESPIVACLVVLVLKGIGNLMLPSFSWKMANKLSRVRHRL